MERWCTDMRKIKDLHPKLQEKIKMLKDECQKQGLKIGIGECLRTKEEQDALYAKGRTAPGKIVTNSKGSTYSSMHQWGIAFDFYRNDGKGAYENDDSFFQKIGNIGKSIGLEWGGDWKSIIDLPHFQLPDWGNTAATLKALYGKPENFFEIWEDGAMTQEERKEFDALEEQVQKLIADKEKVYHYYSELPEYARPTIEKLARKGIYSGISDADLNLPETLMRTLVINDRAGLYD